MTYEIHFVCEDCWYNVWHSTPQWGYRLSKEIMYSDYGPIPQSMKCRCGKAAVLLVGFKITKEIDRTRRRGKGLIN